MTSDPAAPRVTSGAAPAAREPEPGSFPVRRWLQVAARTVHIVAMAFVLGGVAFHADAAPLDGAWAWAAVSGVALLWLDLLKGGSVILQGSGVAVLLKLLLLAIALWIAPGSRLGWLIAATVVASVGSHMPRTWRHRVLLGPRPSSA